MAKYRDRLPQLENRLFITDGGLETTLIFHRGLKLPLFATFDLLKDPQGTAAIREATLPFGQLASDLGAGLILESATWRASRDYARQLGYSDDTLATAIHRAVVLDLEVRQRFETERSPVVISGNVGPRGDGYQVSTHMKPAEAEEYHLEQITTFAATEADHVTGATLTYSDEAIGIARAAQRAKMPVVLSFTVETDGNLPSGERLRGAIEAVDAATNGYPAYYMVNCAYPTHFESVLEPGAPWTRRLRGIRANASSKSHAELNASTALDEGDPTDLAAHYASIVAKFPHLNILGGCCGTGPRHIRTVAEACRCVPTVVWR